VLRELTPKLDPATGLPMKKDKPVQNKPTLRETPSDQ